MSKTVTVTKDNISTLLYFILSMFQRDTVHRQGTSSKNDLIGGYIDRWINKIPENLIFNELLLKDKNYKAINDYFIYNNVSATNAPDILGIKYNNKVIKFTEFENTSWKQINGMPHIEVKTFRKNQNLVSVRDTQLNDDNYYVFIESDFNTDYLTCFFDNEFITNKTFKRNLQMSNEFIKSDDNHILDKVKEIELSSNNLGTLTLLHIIKGSDFKKYTTICNPKENAYYIKNCVETSRVTGKKINIPITSIFNITKFGYCEGTWNNKKMISFYIDKPDSITILKINKKSFYCTPSQDCIFNGLTLLKDKIYKFEIEEFERSSKWTEYVALKNQFQSNVDRTNELIDLFDKMVTKT
jgi:hypothetical protein